ncbi:hypothetical protein BGZ75_005683 [Mortierella antarctica]|nr:hypothetical protein BGZ75_005683 [Mortierella antarctica]
MSSLQYNQLGNLVSIEDSPQSLAPRSAPSMEEMIALMSSSQFSNDSTAAAAAGASRSWRQEDSNYVTATVAAVGGHRRNHD